LYADALMAAAVPAGSCLIRRQQRHPAPSLGKWVAGMQTKELHIYWAVCLFIGMFIASFRAQAYIESTWARSFRVMTRMKAMPTSIEGRQTAKIFQFQVKPRAYRSSANGTASPVVQLSTRRPQVVVDDAWYHQEAMDEAKGTKRR
jgi:hypothetical protein